MFIAKQWYGYGMEQGTVIQVFRSELEPKTVDEEVDRVQYFLKSWSCPPPHEAVSKWEINGLSHDIDNRNILRDLLDRMLSDMFQTNF